MCGALDDESSFTEVNNLISILTEWDRLFTERLQSLRQFLCQIYGPILLKISYWLQQMVEPLYHFLHTGSVTLECGNLQMWQYIDWLAELRFNKVKKKQLPRSIYAADMGPWDLHVLNGRGLLQ